MTVCITLEIINEKGLHARASARLAETADRFDAKVTISANGATVPANSLLGLLTLGAAKGHKIDVVAEGPKAQEAADALRELVENRFGEPR